MQSYLLCHVTVQNKISDYSIKDILAISDVIDWQKGNNE